jgi:hypothetical protein
MSPGPTIAILELRGSHEGEELPANLLGVWAISGLSSPDAISFGR